MLQAGGPAIMANLEIQENVVLLMCRIMHASPTPLIILGGPGGKWEEGSLSKPCELVGFAEGTLPGLESVNSGPGECPVQAR